jgi:hypothetical protein
MIGFVPLLIFIKNEIMHAREPTVEKVVLECSRVIPIGLLPLHNIFCYLIRNQCEMVRRHDLHLVFPSSFQIRLIKFAMSDKTM